MKYQLLASILGAMSYVNTRKGRQTAQQAKCGMRRIERLVARQEQIKASNRFLAKIQQRQSVAA